MGTIASDRERLAEITGDTNMAAGRRPSIVRAVPPDVRLVWNSNIPYSLNDGPLWSGRGTSASISAGIESSVRVRRAQFLFRVAPTVLFSQNRPFPILAGTTPGRSAFASPFHGPESSMDLPLRFGDRPLTRLDPGRSQLAVSGSRVVMRFTADDDWWGPGIRNAIVMSNNAAGIPRVEVATVRPMRTALGSITWKVIAGTLTPSLFFDTTGRGQRTVSGAFINLRPKFDSTLTLGLERVVYAPEGWRIGLLRRLGDFAFRWERLLRPSDTSAVAPPTQRSDQLTAITARWIFPASGFEVYGEWARADLPRSLTELLTAPHYAGAYTIGFQWAHPRRTRSFLRLQSELTYLEQSQVLGDRSFTEYYSGHASPAGYTQRGQVVGAAIGPGASSQWLALDYLAPRWQAGLYAGRVRWENDALYRQFAPNFFRHDVTVLGGVRGARRTPLTDIAFDVTWAYRYNYLFQNGLANPGFYRTVDMRNLTVSLSATPR